jgi:hypothetical protein
LCHPSKNEVSEGGTHYKMTKKLLTLPLSLLESVATSEKRNLQELEELSFHSQLISFENNFDGLL